MTKNNKPISKAKKLRIINLVESALWGAFLTGTALTAVEGTKEVIESIKGDNQVIDFDYGPFSIVFKNNEKREPIALYEEIEKAILEVDNIDKAFDVPNTLSINEKKQILQDIVTAFKETANLKTYTYELKEMYNADGMYMTIIHKYFSIVTEEVVIRESTLNDDFLVSIQTIIHEMTHALENENIMRSSKVSKTYKALYYSKIKDKEYFSSIHELLPHLFSASVMEKLIDKYGEEYTNNICYQVKCAVLYEMILNLYELNTVKYPATLKNLHNLYIDDNKNYKYLTIGELSLKTLEQKFIYKKIDYTQDTLKNTYYHTMFTHYFKEEYMNVRYIDFFHNNYKFSIENITKDISTFKMSLNNIGVQEDYNKAVAIKVAQYVNVFRYNESKVNEEQKLLLSNFIYEYMSDISEENKKEYGLLGVKEIVPEYENELDK